MAGQANYFAPLERRVLSKVCACSRIVGQAHAIAAVGIRRGLFALGIVWGLWHATDLKGQDGTFRGAVVYAPGPYGFLELGRVNHLEMVADSGQYTEQWPISFVNASLVKDDYLYTVSLLGMKVNALQSFENEVACVLF